MSNKKINVLYISYDGITDPLGQSQILPYIIGLSKHNFSFTLLSVEKPIRFKQEKEKIQKICDDNGIEWVPLSYTKFPPIYSTYKDLNALKRKSISLNSNRNFSIVHCRSYISSLVGLMLKRKYQTKFIFDMRGFWADERVDGDLWNLKNPLYKIVYSFFKKKEKAFLKESDCTISLTHNGKNELLSWEDSKSFSPIQVIPCCADLNHFSQENINEELKSQLIDRFQIEKDSIVISYLGSIGTWYMLDEMLLLFKTTQKKYPNSRFLFITRDDKNEIIENAKKHSIDTEKLIITPSSREDVPTYLSLSSINIFFIKPAYSKKSSSPTKQGEVMGMGIPIICNERVGDTAQIVRESKCGKLVNVFSEEEFVKVVDEIPELLNISKQDIRKGAEHFFSLEKGVEKYLTVYKNLLSS